MAYLGEEIKKLGFGLMRLPQKSEGVIDVEQTKVMVDKFMEAGFTYFDTAWAYAGSENPACLIRPASFCSWIQSHKPYSSKYFVLCSPRLWRR